MTSIPLRKVWTISRPRFWIYTFGPYIVGLLIGARDLEELRAPHLWFWALFWTLPANLLIYGVNDIFDYQTDKANPKKSGYETLVTPDERLVLLALIALTCAPFGFALFSLTQGTLWAMFGFLFFSIFYSAPPLRAKSRPVVDSIFNILYAFPGFFAYFLLGGNQFALHIVLAAWCWTMAMHAYSAVPDINADTQAQTPTIATWLGAQSTLYACAALYLLSAALTYRELGTLSILLGAIYGAMMGRSLQARGETQLLAIYQWFPLLNTVSGGALFFWILKSKFL